MPNITRKQLNFDFTAIARQSGIVDKIITFSRASTATRINPTTGLVESVAANIPRINGRQELWKAGSKNLVPYSSDLDNVAWNLNGGYGVVGTASKAGTIPGIGADAFLITLTPGGTQGRRVNLVPVTVGATYSGSVYMKRGSVDTVEFYSDLAVSGIGFQFNFVTKTLTPFASTGSAYTELADGWFRVVFTFVAPSAVSQFGFKSDNAATVYAGATQLELGSTTTAYEPNPVVIQPGLLVEGAATNVLHNSNNLTLWDKYQTTVAQNVTGPDGVSSSAWACTLQGGGGVGVAFISSAPYLPPDGTQLVISVWAYGNGVDKFTFGFNDTFMSPQTIARTGWNRYYYTAAFTNTQSGRLGEIVILGVDQTTINFFGVQIEAGTFPSSYVPTTGATVARAAEVATVDVSKIWNAQEGTLIAEVDFGPVNGTYQTMFDVNGNAFQVYRRPVGEVAVSDTSFGTNVTRGKAATTAARCTFNGGPASNGAKAYPSPNTMYLGTNSNNGEVLNGTIQSFQYLPYALDDLTLKFSSQLK